MTPSPARILEAGPLTAVLENGSLRNITYAKHDVLREIYVAVRDRNWGTASPVVERVNVEEKTNEFLVQLRTRHVSSEIDFVWDGEIYGNADGQLRFSFHGVAGRDFLRNRIGFCILHSAEAAGTTLTAQTPQGEMVGVLPPTISPHLPFVDMESLRWEPAPNLSAHLRFHGDLFEMEDQRNWTDASLKTFGTPLRLPFPVQVRGGETVEQSVTLTIQPLPGGFAPKTKTRPPPADIVVGTRAIGRLPLIGLMVGDTEAAHDARTVQRLRELHLSHLWLELDLTGSDWADRLQKGAALARAVETSLEVQIVCGDQGEGLDALAAHLAAKPNAPSLRRLSVFPASEWTTSDAVLNAARTVFEPGTIVLGGGSRAYFAQLNRAEDLPLSQMDFVGFTITPQVHAFDDEALFSSLPMQHLVARQAAQSLAGGSLPVCVGPITLRPRVQPAATGSPVLPLPDELPPDTDARQNTDLCAAWTLGSLSHLARAGAASVTYFETMGPRGVLDEQTGSPFPVYHVFAAVGAVATPGAAVNLLETENNDEKRVAVLALRNNKQVRIMIASLSHEAQSVSLRLPFSSPATDVWFVNETACPVSADDSGRLRFDVLPFAVVCVDLISKGEKYDF